MRGLVVIAVVASLVWCPIRCLATAVPSSNAVEVKSPPKCACCCHRSESPASSKNFSESSDESQPCACADCVCDGALRTAVNDVTIALLVFAINRIATEALEFSATSIDDTYAADVPIRRTPTGADLVILLGELRR